MSNNWIYFDKTFVSRILNHDSTARADTTVLHFLIIQLRCSILKIGVFHPALNVCGGGEWVALNIINTLRRNGHKVIVLTDARIDQNKYMKTFGQKLRTDGEIIFPFHLFSRGDAHNIYTDTISCLILKSKCDIVIDTYTRMILPGVDVIYMHYPIFTRSSSQSKKLRVRLKSILYFILYHAYEAKVRKKKTKILFANSKFTSIAIKTYHGLHSHILYPSLSPFFLPNKEVHNGKRLDQVVTISRFAPEKRLEMIPYVAKRLEKIKFLIIGNLHHKNVYSRLVKLINNLNVADKVFLLTEVPKDQLRGILLNSKVYFHCAIDEHFGISVIEAMASGCVPIVHDSGGPKEIVPEKFRYKTIDEATEKIRNAIKIWSPEGAWEMRNNTLKFSQDNFSKEFLTVLYSHGLLRNAVNNK